LDYVLYAVSRVRHSLTARTLAISGIFAVMLAASFAVLIFAIEQLRDAGRAAVRAQEAVTVGTELQKSVANLENGLRGYVATGRNSTLTPFDTARRQYPSEVRRLEALAMDDPGLRKEVLGIAQQIGDYVDLWALPLLGVARDDLEVARSVIVNSTGIERVDAIRRSFRRMFARARAEAARREASAESRSRVAVALGIAGIFAVLGLSGGLALALRRGLLRPIQRVAMATEVVAAGDLTERVPSDRHDEIGDLARAFNAMAESLERSRVELGQRAEELERSNRELEDYASVTSHDLQGPLVTVGMYSEMLTQRLRHDPDARQLAENIRDGAAGMRKLVRELLAYARLDRRAAEPEPVALDDALREAVDSLAGPIQDAGAEIEAEPLPVVMGDPPRLVQLLQNLLTNAIKFTTEDTPRVEVTARGAGDMVIVSVRDNGIGLDPSKTEVIFRPFHRLHGADRYAGTGIGLAVCQKIVDQHGGRIWAESRPGEGATFCFTLPRADGVAAPTSEREPVAPGAPAVP
jgi:signal transduction histidine kinase